MNSTQFLDRINESAQRFAARSAERARRQAEIDAHGVTRGNPVEVVEQRKAVLKAQREQGTQQSKGIVADFDSDSLAYVLGANDSLDIRFLELGITTARAVGRIINSKRQFNGTGFLIGQGLLLTNHHVLRSVSDAQNSEVVFNFQRGRHGQMSPSTAFQFSPSNFFMTDKTLDYTLVAVQPVALGGGGSIGRFGHIPLRPDVGHILVGERVNIIQHPGGRPKQVAMRDNRVLDLLPQHIHYKTDTQGGSSGSPVLNDQWELVALHHAGVPMRNDAGQILMLSGVPWERDRPREAIHWVANEGVRIGAIIEHVSQQRMGPMQALLWSDLLRT